MFQSFLKVRISESDSDSDHLYDHVPVKDQLEMLKHLPEGVSIVKLSVPVEHICHGGYDGWLHCMPLEYSYKKSSNLIGQ